MKFRPLFLCLSLCAAPLAAAPFRAGEIRFSPAASSRIAPRLEDFMDLLCAAEEIEPPPLPPIGPDKNSARCCDKVSNKPPCEAYTALPEFGIAALQAAGDGTLRASVFARTFDLKAPKPIETRCGRWTWSLRLDRRATQPVAAMTLRPGARATPAGTADTAGAFSGTLPIKAQLEFRKAGGGRRLTLPVTLRLDLTGTWTTTAAPPADDRLLFSVAGAKSLILPEGAEK